MIDSENLVRVCRRLLLCLRPPGATPAAKSARNFLHLAVFVPVHLRTPHDQRAAEPWGIATGRICSNGFERRGLSCWRSTAVVAHLVAAACHGGCFCDLCNAAAELAVAASGERGGP